MGTSNLQIVQSVGIDIGTSTTQFVVSRLTVKNVAPGSLVPRFAITDKEVRYKSDIHFTPIDGNNRVDADKIFTLIRSEFDRAGVSPETIDTGAVIITGETAKKENAKSISAKVAGIAGDFVVATAGGKLESIIAGKGSGASDLSRRDYATVANIDIGGGTANVGIFKNGKALDSCCINVGGRLLQVDRSTAQVTAVSEPMKAILEDCDLGLSPGDTVTRELLGRICRRMSTVILECLGKNRLSPLAERLLMTDPLRLDYDIDTVMVSGGVADHVYAPSSSMALPDATRYGDIGPLFGLELAQLFQARKVPVAEPTETIRATVIGAGAQTVDVSGSTILADDEVLPFKNIPVAIPFSDTIPVDEADIAQAVTRSIDNFYENDALDKIAIGITGNQYFSFKEIQALARGLIKGLAPVIRAGFPAIIVLEADIGKVLGQSMKAVDGNMNIVCVDQLLVTEGDYVDIGKSIAGGTVVPVVIKSLVFETKQI
ncbi:MAG: ethanolamine ammonia-lyase reactivating factor EutA [Desulfobacteraceae bacterium]|nr:ethanolamine ammonia-lyase reactivating factor EutA [Desulfobacteraceae bacterium]